MSSAAQELSQGATEQASAAEESTSSEHIRRAVNPAGPSIDLATNAGKSDARDQEFAPYEE